VDTLGKEKAKVDNPERKHATALWIPWERKRLRETTLKENMPLPCGQSLV